MHFREKKSVREIVRLTSLSRYTVRKWLNTPVLEEPRYRRSDTPGKLTLFVEEIKQALEVAHAGLGCAVCQAFSVAVARHGP